ncbi:hypothetical protein [Roseibium album]|uniref:hypothetical protein n=1 Tax=Roseibium album TaxID=311410 RepID=UPI003BAF4D65
MEIDELLETDALDTEEIQDSASEEDEQSSETEVDDVEVDEDAETDEAEAEEDDEEIDLGDDDVESELEEVEFQGKNYKIHPDLKLALMRDADYTQKSQANAETKRALDEQQQSFEQQVQGHRELMGEYAQFQALQNQIDQYSNVDWNALEEQDPLDAGRHWRNLQQLKEAQQKVGSGIRQKEHERSQAAQREDAKRTEEYVSARNKAIPDWSDDLNLQLTTFAKTYGYSEQDVGSLRDPRMLQILREAMDGRQLRQKLQKQQAAARKAAKKVKTQEEVKPLKKQAKGRTSARNGLDDNMSTDDWLKVREKQVAARGGY